MSGWPKPCARDAAPAVERRRDARLHVGHLAVALHGAHGGGGDVDASRSRAGSTEVCTRICGWR